jgi:hypothetical protein
MASRPWVLAQCPEVPLPAWLAATVWYYSGSDGIRTRFRAILSLELPRGTRPVLTLTTDPGTTERDTGIEPVLSPWQGDRLPLHQSRLLRRLRIHAMIKVDHEIMIAIQIRHRDTTYATCTPVGHAPGRSSSDPAHRSIVPARIHPAVNINALVRRLQLTFIVPRERFELPTPGSEDRCSIR